MSEENNYAIWAFLKKLHEEFKVFAAFKDIVSNILKNVKEDNSEDEENKASKEFEEVNLVKVNKQSMTIL